MSLNGGRPANGPTAQLMPAATEADIYRALGLPFIPPEIRNGDDEIAAARARHACRLSLPATDIRGDLHMHSPWSDGRDPIEAMVDGVPRPRLRVHGHHRPLAAFGRLAQPDARQRQAAGGGDGAGCASVSRDIAILHGCEVDILPDGRLDFPDRVLERFDIVLASLHEQRGPVAAISCCSRYGSGDAAPARARSSRIRPTASCRSRPGYDLDYDRLFEMAVETGTLVEIDGAPSHLDLDGALARRAVAAGATCSIDSDCHRADMLDRQMDLGVATARRGWVEPRHVLNTRPLADVSVARSRAKRGRALSADAWPGRRTAPLLVVAVAAFAPLSRDAAPRRRLRRHRLVPDDGRLAD